MVSTLDIIYNTPKDKRSEVINNYFDFDKIKSDIRFYWDSKYICNDIINIICNEEYDIEKMRKKFNNYISRIKNGQLSLFFIIPFKVTRLKGEPSYESEKCYENGCRKYKSYVTHYEYFPYLSKELDIFKVDSISRQVNYFFDFKSGKKNLSNIWKDEDDFYNYMKHNILGDHCIITSEHSTLDDIIYDYDFP